MKFEFNWPVVIETKMFQYIDGKISNLKLVAMTFNVIKQIKVVVMSAIDDSL